MLTFKPLWKLLIDKDIKKKDFADMINVTPQTISNMSSNKSISWALLDEICCVLNCQPGDVVQYEKDTEWYQKHKDS